VAFYTEERSSEDVSEDVAEEIRRRCDLQMRGLPVSISDFVEGHERQERQPIKPYTQREGLPAKEGSVAGKGTECRYRESNRAALNRNFRLAGGLKTPYNEGKTCNVLPYSRSLQP
jgi:hypothetical protein